jgi:hypothetical protein
MTSRQGGPPPSAGAQSLLTLIDGNFCACHARAPGKPEGSPGGRRREEALPTQPPYFRSACCFHLAVPSLLCPPMPIQLQQARRVHDFAEDPKGEATFNGPPESHTLTATQTRSHASHDWPQAKHYSPDSPATPGTTQFKHSPPEQK